MRVLLHATLAGGLLVASTGCAVLGAKSPPPALNMPEPPSRLVMPPADPPEPPPAVAPPAANAPKPGASTVVPTNPPPVNRPASTSSTAAPPPPTTTPLPPESAPVLQTTPSTLELQHRVQTQIDNANRDLKRVDRNSLSKEAREQYDWAARLCRQAEDYQKNKSFDMADQCADKAARMASLLAKGSISPTSF